MIGLVPAAIAWSVGAAILVFAEADAYSWFYMTGCLVAWYLVTYFLIREKHWSVLKQLSGFTACLFFPVLGWVIICLTKPNGPKCIYCGSLLNPGASVCAKCGRDQVRPTSAKSVPCPFCGKPIPESSLVAGRNACPHCGQVFECEP